MTADAPTDAPAAGALALTSMTGFARAEGVAQGFAWTIEVKSVNGRSLDIRCRLPAGVEVLEPGARTEIARRFKRGSIHLVATVTRTAAVQQLRVNRALVDQVLALGRALAAEGLVEPPRLDTVLAVRGVIETADDTAGAAEAEVRDALAAGVAIALDRLAAARAAEGARLAPVIRAELDEIAALTEAAADRAAAQPAAARERLRAQLETLLAADPPVPEERLAQELALLAARGDIREELDRLRAHVAAARTLVDEGAAIGRRLDFLCQEFNREANTLCSKSGDVDLTRIGLALKATIEQLREQVQNIE